MMFDIRKKFLGDSVLVELINCQTLESVTILPEYGGSIHQILASKEGAFYPLLWSDDSQKEYLESGRAIYKGALLFPFTDRVESGRYSFDKFEHQLDCNSGSHALHGFLNTQSFQIVSEIRGSENASVELLYQYQGDQPGYPFKFDLLNRYSLDQGGFTVETTIKNSGDGAMPFALGWHPYFSVKNFQGLTIELPSDEEWLIDPDYISRGSKAPVRVSTAISPELLDGIYLKCFKWLPNKPSIRLLQEDVPLSISISTPESAGYDFFQVYLHENNKGIAIEPLTGIGNCFNNGIGLSVLEKSEERRFAFAISWKESIG